MVRIATWTSGRKSLAAEKALEIVVGRVGGNAEVAKLASQTAAKAADECLSLF